MSEKEPSPTEHTSLQAALLAFQSECPTLPKDATNPHFNSKFTSLDTIVEGVRPLLAKHGLTWSTFPCSDERGPALRYVLAHAASNETAEGTMPLLLSKTDPQGQGSAITYARRYSMCAVLNLVADVDDDGNAGGNVGGRQQTRSGNGRSGRGVSADQPKATEPAANAGQRGKINAQAAEAGLSPVEFANLLRAAAGQEPKDFDDDEQAALDFIRRFMGRMPARLVDPVLAAIAGAGVTA